MKTFRGAYINLLKTSIGSGVLNFPFLFKTYGILATVALTVISGFFASAGLVLLSICASLMGRTADMSTLSRLAIPHARILVDLAVLIKCFGVSTSYAIIARQLLPAFIETIASPYAEASKQVGRTVHWLTRPAVSLILFFVPVTPFCMLYRMDALKYTSLVGVVSISVVILAAIVRYASREAAGPGIALIAPVTIGWLGGLGKFLFSFTCHQNIFVVNAEMENNSLGRLKKLIYSVSGTAFVLYMSFGLTNYLLYGETVLDNVLKNYPPDYMATVVRGLYVIVMAVSYPLQLAPARTYLFNILSLSETRRKARKLRYSMTLLIILMTYAIAASGTQLGLVYTIVGATASTFMCLILPALFYFNMEVKRSVGLSVIAYLAFILGVVIFGSTMVSIAAGVRH